MTEISRDEAEGGFVSYAGDSMISTKQADANATCDETVAALKEIGLETDEAKPQHSRPCATEWEHDTHQHEELIRIGNRRRRGTR